MKQLIVLFLFMTSAAFAQIRIDSVTVANTADTSSATFINNRLYGFNVPSTFNADTITVLVADAIDGTYEPVYDATDGSTLGQYAVTAGQRYLVPPTKAYAIKGWIKIMYNSAANSAQVWAIYDGVY